VILIICINFIALVKEKSILISPIHVHIIKKLIKRSPSRDGYFLWYKIGVELLSYFLILFWYCNY